MVVIPRRAGQLDGSLFALAATRDNLTIARSYVQDNSE
jgi:hypothetical protein